MSYTKRTQLLLRWETGEVKSTCNGLRCDGKKNDTSMKKGGEAALGIIRWSYKRGEGWIRDGEMRPHWVIWKCKRIGKGRDWKQEARWRVETSEREREGSRLPTTKWFLRKLGWMRYRAHIYTHLVRKVQIVRKMYTDHCWGLKG